jgi:hypothetical protein
VLYAFGVANSGRRQKNDLKIRTLVGDGEQLGTHTHGFDREFLGEFPSHRILIGLSRLTLPTRKLPQATMAFMRWSLAQKNFVLATDDGRDDPNTICVLRIGHAGR